VARTMKIRPHEPTTHERWANLRFSVVGPLLAAPPARGELQAELERLAAKGWRHPVTGEPRLFGLKTIQRWYYEAKRAPSDPVGQLRKKHRKDSGRQTALSDALKRAIHAQYAAHRSWTYQLHYDNLAAWVEAEPELGRLPAYATVRRYMRSVGLSRRRKIGGEPTEGKRRAEQRLDEREVRSYEHEYVNGLWHLDFHHGRKKVLVVRGEYVTPIVLGILDDHSRLACHLQWYLAENAENLVHGLSQAIQKRGLPRSLMTDNGKAMTADETRQGLARLGIVHETTLPHSPYQNAKQESYWAQLEGRLVAMLENVAELTLARLNEITQAWVEGEYNRKRHSEIGTTPLHRFLDGKDVGRPSPTSEVLRQAFCAQERRTQRKSDGTISLEGRRFELPSRYRHLDRVTLRYASWDLTWVHLVDERTGAVLCRLYPLDKAANADGMRRTIGPLAEPVVTATEAASPAPMMPPLLAKLVAAQADTGLPPAYLPKDERVRDITGGGSDEEGGVS
jgi:transposase InsO family protein